MAQYVFCVYGDADLTADQVRRLRQLATMPGVKLTMTPSEPERESATPSQSPPSPRRDSKPPVATPKPAPTGHVRLPPGTLARLRRLGHPKSFRGHELKPNAYYPEPLMAELAGFLREEEQKAKAADKPVPETHRDGPVLERLRFDFVGQARLVVGPTFEGQPIDHDTAYDAVWIARLHREYQRIVDTLEGDVMEPDPEASGERTMGFTYRR